MKHLFIKTVLFLLVLTLSNCEIEQLPPIRQTGANTFGAIVDYLSQKSLFLQTLVEI